MIIDEVLEQVKELQLGETQATVTAHIALLAIHIKALACHCECLGMNAENSSAICQDRNPPFDSISYDTVMQKWGLTNEKGEPTI